MRNKFLAAVFAATMAVSGLVGVAPASATPTTQTAETPTVLTHTNSSLGTGAVLTLTPATWGAGIFAPGELYFEFVLTNSCTLGGTADLIVPSNSAALSGSGTIFTVPASLDLNNAGTPSPFQTAGMVVWATTAGENSNNIGSSRSVGFELGVGLCGGGPLLPPPPPPPPTLPPVAAPPYTGPMITPPAGVIAASAGGQVTIPGSRLGGVSKVEIAGLDAEVTVSSDGELSIVVPRGLAAGVYDLLITSSAGRLTVQDAIRVSGSAASSGAAGDLRASTRMIDDGSLKVWVFGAAGDGKVQIKLNGQEVAWVNATSADDPKLRDGYLVRTLTLAAGKNVIEVYVDGERVSRRVATGS